MSKAIGGSTKALPFLFGAVVIDVAGIGMIAPITPMLISELSEKSLAQAAMYAGWLLAVFAMMQFIAAPVVGNLSDHFGRRPILLFTMILYACSYLFMAVADSLIWLFVARCLSGLTSATHSTAIAYLIDITKPDDRTRRFGKMSACFALGWIIGPAIGGALGTIDTRLPLYFASALAFANAIYGFLFLPESLPVANRRHFQLRTANPISNWLYLSRFPRAQKLLKAQAIFLMASVALPTLWPFYTLEKFGWPPITVGLSITAFGILNVLAQTFLLHRLLRQLGEITALQLAIACTAFSYLGFSFATHWWMAVGSMLIWSIGALMGPTTNSLITQSVNQDSQGALQGALASLQSVVGVVMPPIMTWLFGYFNAGGAPFIFSGAPFFLSAVITLIGWHALQRLGIFHGEYR